MISPVKISIRPRYCWVVGISLRMTMDPIKDTKTEKGIKAETFEREILFNAWYQSETSKALKMSPKNRILIRFWRVKT